MNETCPTCGKHGYRRCEGNVGFDIQSGPLQCRNVSTHYIRETHKRTGVRGTIYLCPRHYRLAMAMRNRREMV